MELNDGNYTSIIDINDNWVCLLKVGFHFNWINCTIFIIILKIYDIALNKDNIKKPMDIESSLIAYNYDMLIVFIHLTFVISIFELLLLYFGQ